MLKFFTHQLSPWAKRVQFLLEEMVLPYETTVVKLQDKQQHQPEFTEISPYSRVPAIIDGDFKLSESGAIMRYLVARYNRFDLMPVNLEDRAKVDEAFEFTTIHINRPLLDLAWQRHFAPKYNQPCEQVIVDRAEKYLKRDFAIFEKMLSGRDFLVTHECSIADINATPFVAMCEFAEWPIENYPNAKSWLKRMTARPAWHRCG